MIEHFGKEDLVFVPGSNRTYLVAPDSKSKFCYYHKNTALTQFDNVGLLWLPGNEEKPFAFWSGSALTFYEDKEVNLGNLLYLSTEEP